MFQRAPFILFKVGKAEIRLVEHFDVRRGELGTGVDETGKFRGTLRSTGLRPQFTERLAEHGVGIPPGLFELERW